MSAQWPTPAPRTADPPARSRSAPRPALPSAEPDAASTLPGMPQEPPTPWWRRSLGAARRRRPAAAEVRQGGAAAAAEGEDPHDVGDDARLDRRLQPHLGLEVRRSASSLLLLVHEMGHVIQLRREGIEASAPMFIPFLGAAVMAKSLGDDATAEARVGLAGPILGTLGALALLPIAIDTRRRLLVRARLHRPVPQPLQPAAGRAAGRRPRDGRAVAEDVVRRALRAGRADVHRSRTRSSS